MISVVPPSPPARRPRGPTGAQGHRLRDAVHLHLESWIWTRNSAELRAATPPGPLRWVPTSQLRGALLGVGWLGGGRGVCHAPCSTDTPRSDAQNAKGSARRPELPPPNSNCQRMRTQGPGRGLVGAREIPARRRAARRSGEVVLPPPNDASTRAQCGAHYESLAARPFMMDGSFLNLALFRPPRPETSGGSLLLRPLPPFEIRPRPPRGARERGLLTWTLRRRRRRGRARASPPSSSPLGGGGDEDPPRAPPKRHGAPCGCPRGDRPPPP